MEGSLLVLGNLLLDMVVPVNHFYLQAHNLIPDSIQTATDIHLKIYADISKREDVVVSPGGSALNTVRMTQRILGIPNLIVFVGAVGSDETGTLLVDTVEKEGIKMLVQYVKDVPTGRCACLLTNEGSARTMVTDLGAALKFSHSNFMDCRINFDAQDKAKFLYISGYFLKVSSETALEVAKRVKARDIPVLLNLNAVWVTTSCKLDIQALLPLVDVIFGNEAEIKSFAGENGLISSANSSSFDSATALSSLLSTFHTQSSERKLVVMTRGEFPVVCSENGNMVEYPIPLVPKNNLVDSTGAGDAFVGGFLASFIQKKSLEDCIFCGIWAATEELKGYGFVLPTEIPQQFQTTL